MIGHARPSSLALALARAAFALCAYVASIAAAQVPALPSGESVTVRITWGSGEACRWVGRIAIDDGSLSNLKQRGTDPDAAGSIWLDEGQLRIAALSAHKRDSIEFLAQSNATSKLRIELAPSDKDGGPQLEIPLADLPRHPYQTRLDDRGNTLEVQIVPPPALQISPARDPLIFSPGEQCSFEMTPAIANLTPGTELEVRTTLSSLSPAHRNELLWRDDQRVAVPVDGHPKVAISVPLPKTEGAYTIHVSATRPSGFERFWSASTRLAERSFEVVVLDSNPSATAKDARWDSVLEIDPTNPRWVERLPAWTQVRRIPGLNHGAMGSSRAAAVDLPLGRFIELPPATPATGPHWQAYSLPLEAVGVPHALEIDYPADADQYFAISIVEPNANGLVAGFNRDAGVYVEGLGRSEARQKHSQRLVFWPRTQAPLLVVTNLHPSAAAHFGQIRVFKRSTSQLSEAPVQPMTRDRLIAAYLARSTVGETFGAMRAVEAPTGPSGTTPECVDDSETALESATRLSDYLRYSGYNSAIVRTATAGVPQLPITQSLPAAPNLFSRQAAKLLDLDSTELMLRVFDRDGLALLPAIDFSAPIPQLETLRRTSDPHASGLEWVGDDGRTWLEANGNRRGQAPYYNLLDPRVQQAMLEIVRDVVDRYNQHRAFAGLAIQLSSDGYAQLPPLDWGFDDATVGRFQRDTGIQLADNGPDRFAIRHTLLTGQHAVAWRSWRAAQTSAFYGRLAALVRGNTDRRLVLTTENVFAHPLLAARMRPNLRSLGAEARAASVMLDVGLDQQNLERVPGIVFCPTRYVGPTTPLPDRAVDLELNGAFSLGRQPASQTPSRSTLLYHRPQEQKLASFEARGQSPWKLADGMRLVCQPTPDGPAARQAYVEALLKTDSTIFVDGGELLPLGQEDALRDVRSTIAQLPVAAETSELAKQPIVVRTYVEANRVTLLAMNTSPWSCDAQIMLDLPQPSTLEPVAAAKSTSGAAIIPVTLSAGRQSWALALAPYEMRAVRVSASGVKVADIQADPAPTGIAELAARLADLNSRDLTAPRNYQALANPSFEPISGSGRVPGWHATGVSGRVTAELDPTKPQDGRSCLYVRCEGQSAVVESDPFPVPPTGQLAMTVFARGQNLRPETELRLVFESDRGGPTYRRAAIVHANDMQRPDGQWGRPVAILVDDLPLDSNGKMRIAFELSGPGEIWLDNVKLYDLLFPLTFYSNAQAEYFELYKQIHAANSAFESRQVSDCLRILDGYWPRFIIAYRPPVIKKIVEGDATKTQPSPPQPNEGQEPTPGLSDRIKRLLPGWR